MDNEDFTAPIDVLKELGTPTTQRGMPNFRDHVPRRFVTLEEAQARGWSMFWTGAACRYGHQAARKTANPNACSDCDREKRGQPPIYPRARNQQFYESPRRAPKLAPIAITAPPSTASTPTAPPAPVVIMQPAPAPKTPEVDQTDRAFLTKYAEMRDLEAAAVASGCTAAQINSRRSHQRPLDEAMTKLEAELAIPKFVPAPSEFEWDADKRARLLEAYIDSGNLAIARDAIKCTPSQLWRELDANPQFSAQLDAARERAAQVFEEEAHRQALAGNDRLIPLVLKAELPDKYQEKSRLEIRTDLSRLTEEQLNARLFALIARSPGIRLIEDGELIEGTATPALPAPEADPIEDPESEPEASAPEAPQTNNEDLL